MDADLDGMTREQLIGEVRRLRRCGGCARDEQLSDAPPSDAPYRP